MGTALLEEPRYSNVEQTEFISNAEELLYLGCTPLGSTSLTFLQASRGTLGDLIASELFGIWRGRPGLEDTLNYARELRATTQRRSGGQR